MSQKPKVLVLTANIGNYDKMESPQFVSEHCDYIAVSDNQKNVPEGWKYVEYNSFSALPDHRYIDRRNAKICKILSTIFFQDYEYILWHDANKQLVSDPVLFIEKHKDFDILIGTHSRRNCVYVERAACRGRDSYTMLTEQMECYKGAGMPKRYGLWGCWGFVVKNTDAIRTLQLMWWEQICKYSSRDQLSLPFCLYKMKDQINLKSTPEFKGVLLKHTGGDVHHGHLKAY
jgi:hypothetical protein